VFHPQGTVNIHTQVRGFTLGNERPNTVQATLIVGIRFQCGVLGVVFPDWCGTTFTPDLKVLNRLQITGGAPIPVRHHILGDCRVTTVPAVP
jgi:hypothetical protein